MAATTIRTETAARAGRLAVDDVSNEHRQRLRRLEDEYGPALFARGFLLSRHASTYVPRQWLQEGIGDYQLYRDPQVSFHRFQDHRGADLVLLGDAFDLRVPARSNHDVAWKLFQALGRSRAHLHDLTDWIHGRYVVIYRSLYDLEPRMLADATGMRTIYHTSHGEWAGTHASLVAVNSGKSPSERPTARFGYPGRMTPYRDVLLLVPNHELAVSSGEIQRFYPRHPLRQLDADEVADLAAHWLKRAATGVVARHPSPLVSLTAGLDSRTTLASTRHAAARVRCFTYYRSDDTDTDKVDHAVATELASTLGLQHQVINTRKYTLDLPSSFNALCAENAYYNHMRSTVYAYTKLFDPETDVHIRSNLSEIGRCFYRKVKRVGNQTRTGGELADVYASFSPSLSTSERISIKSDFEEFYNATGFWYLEGQRDTRDMLYWEHRMGAWHGPAITESDPAFRTYSLYNARVILDLLMSAPETDRIRGSHLKGIVARCWQQCLALPINPK